jgi:micrococcal nuclease
MFMAKQRTSRLPWFFLTLIFCAASFAGGYYFYDWRTTHRTTYPVTVTDVIDGDTIEVEWFGGVSRLRLIGVDTFETKHNRKLRRQAADWGVSEERAYNLGHLAKIFGEDTLLGREVTIQFAGDGIQRDAFGRLLAYVFVNEEDYGILLLQNGLAYTREEEHPRQGYYEWPMVQAENDGKGIHARVK